MSPFTADAVEASHICDEFTPPDKGKDWRVAFYKNQRLFAVIPRALNKADAHRIAKEENMIIAKMIEDRIRDIARVGS